MVDVEEAYMIANKHAINNDCYIESMFASKDGASYWFYAIYNKFANLTKVDDPSSIGQAYKLDVTNGQISVLDLFDLMDANLIEEPIDLTKFRNQLRAS